MGSNHGKGSFQCGAKIILTETKSFGFEISVAVIILWKDSTEVIKKSILTELTKGLKLMAENNSSRQTILLQRIEERR